MKKSTQALVVASKDSELEVNANKTKYMAINARQSHNIKIDCSSFEMVEMFKHLGTTPTNQNSIQVEIKSSLKTGNVCYHSGQDLFYSS
jgi:hypothetical protein